MASTPASGAWKILTPKGDLVVSQLPGLRIQMEALEKETSPRVALDLTHVRNIDSATIGFLTLFSRRMQEQGGRFSLFGACHEISDVLDLVNFRKRAKVYVSRKEFEQMEGGCG